MEKTEEFIEFLQGSLVNDSQESTQISSIIHNCMTNGEISIDPFSYKFSVELSKDMTQLVTNLSDLKGLIVNEQLLEFKNKECTIFHIEKLSLWSVIVIKHIWKYREVGFFDKVMSYLEGFFNDSSENKELSEGDVEKMKEEYISKFSNHVCKKGVEQKKEVVLKEKKEVEQKLEKVEIKEGKPELATIISGKKISRIIRGEIKEKVDKLSEKPGLAVILVGNRPDSATYVKFKEKACGEVGIRSIKKTFQENVSEKELVEEVRKLNDQKDVDGILVQLPLPKGINEENVLREISIEKDVDGFHPLNIGKLCMKGRKPLFTPCTPRGCIELLDRMKIPISGTNAVVVGRSNIVGIPVAMLLMHRNATVTICHSRTQNISDIVKQADILVAALGIPKYVKSQWIKPGCAIIDVGINEIEDKTRKSGKRLVGDVDYFPCKEIAGFITPVPNGVGPMTIAMLLQATLDSCERRLGKTE